MTPSFFRHDTGWQEDVGWLDPPMDLEALGEDILDPASTCIICGSPRSYYQRISYDDYVCGSTCQASLDKRRREDQKKHAATTFRLKTRIAVATG